MFDGKETRREFLARSAAVLAAGWSESAQQGAVIFAYVGCFTTRQRYARGDGIHVYRVNAESGACDHAQLVRDLVNPSFLVMRRDQRFLYSAHGDEGYASSFSVDRESGELAFLNRAETAGSNGVHLAIDPSARFLVVANYASGSVSVMPIREDGTLADAAHVWTLPGQPGPNRVEQASSHPHQVVFDPSGRFLVVPDKGLDRTFVFRFDSKSGALTPTAQGSSVARSGSGPRHACFHPNLPVLWVLNEINSTVATCYWDAERGHLRPVQILAAIPPDCTGENTSAEIAVSSGGRFVYCSNRGHDSVAIFAADPATGLLTSVGWEPSRGRTPRFICLDPSSQFLFIANEQSDTVIIRRVDPKSGRLSPGAELLRTPSPVTIAFARWDASSRGDRRGLRERTPGFGMPASARCSRRHPA
jgi:6-phosphogluconolactonase (cycloisomerase 2 family)